MEGQNKPCGIYIHIPFCVRKCLYCDFTSYAGREDIFDEYVDSLIGEMRGFAGKAADTVFIGGGTPTILSPYSLERLLCGIHDIFDIQPGCEISIEANPGTLDSEKIRVLRRYVNRISVGVQSFNNDELAALGRIHSAEEALGAVILVRDNFENFSIDIMSSVPRQNKESFRKTLMTAANTGAPHISCYSLIIEEGTPFYDMARRNPQIIPGEDYDRDMYAFTKEFLSANGYERYEISNYAKEGYECRHNMKYWNTEEYLGFGAAAHSFSGGRRYFNSGVIEEYMKRKGGGGESLDTDDMISEFVFMGMRKTAGIEESEFRNRFGKDIYDVYGTLLRERIKEGFIIEKDGRLFLSDRGIDISNYILCDFVL